MSQLHYMTKRGAGVMVSGTAAELGKRMMRLRCTATLRSDHGAEIGRVVRCEGECGAFDAQSCPGNGWHAWYDQTGDDVQPEPNEES